MVTPYNLVFKEMGYPELDLKEWDDGEFAIIQYHQRPIIPCLTRWSYVLTGLRNVERSYGFFRKWTEQLDLEKRFIWAEEERKQEELRKTIEYEDRRSELKTELAFKAIRQNPDLMERIAEKGLDQLQLRQISRHIPNHRFRR
jgi:hypothetical protein